MGDEKVWDGSPQCGPGADAEAQSAGGGLEEKAARCRTYNVILCLCKLCFCTSLARISLLCHNMQQETSSALSFGFLLSVMCKKR